MTDEQLDDNGFETAEEVAVDERPQYGVGPFSIREVALGGVWLIAFVISFFSINAVRFDSVWTSGLLWILAIGVPTVAVFLIGLRRLSPDGIRRVGSLGIDQFASVAFSVATVVWLQIIWETVAIVVQEGPWLRTWVIWVEFFLMLAGVLLTVFAPFIAPFDEDFRGRREIPAHRSARPIRAVSPRPVVERPAPAAAGEPGDNGAAPAFADTATYDTSAPAAADTDTPPAYAQATAYEPGAQYEPAAQYESEGQYEPEAEYEPADVSSASADSDAVVIGETWAVSSTPADEPVVEVYEAEPVVAPVRQQAFWALTPEDRDVVDETGIPLFRIGPTAWALVIEDRGEVFVVRHEDGRIGYLHDVEGVTRG